MELTGKRILILAGEGFEDLELFYPYYRFREASADVVVAGEVAGHSVIGKHGIAVKVDKSFGEVKMSDFDVLIIPGGRGPERLRRIPKAVDLVKEAAAGDKIIGAICHGPQLLVSARIIRGKKVTSDPMVQAEVEAYGAEYLDQEVVVDGNLITSRKPDDLPAFCRTIIDMLTRVRTKEVMPASRVMGT